MHQYVENCLIWATTLRIQSSHFHLLSCKLTGSFSLYHQSSFDRSTLKIYFEKCKVFTHSAGLSFQVPSFWDISIALSSTMVKYIFSYILSEVLIHFSLHHLSRKAVSPIVQHEFSASICYLSPTQFQLLKKLKGSSPCPAQRKRNGGR